jgi:hypothetical protein
MRQARPGDDSIVVYNASFELGRLEECRAVHPEFTTWVNGLKRRVVDRLLPFRGFRYYHAMFACNWNAFWYMTRCQP